MCQPARTAVAVWLALCFCMVSGCGRGPSEVIQGLARLEPDSIPLDASKDANNKGECDRVIQVTNDGRDTVRIRQILADCACTAVGSPTKTLLDHGETADIPIRVQLPTMGVRKSRVTVVVEAGDGQQALVATFFMRGRPIEVPSILNVPTEVRLRCDAQGNATTPVGVRTYEKASSPPWIGNAIAEGAGVSIEFSDIREDDSPEPGVKIRHYTYSLKAKRVSEIPGENGNATARIALRTAATVDRPLASFYVRVEEWRPLRLVPQVLFVERIAGTTGGIAREVRVVFCDERFHPTGVEAASTASWIHVKSATLRQLGDTREALVAVELGPDLRAGGGSNRANLLVKVHDDHGNSVDATVPVVTKSR